YAVDQADEASARALVRKGGSIFMKDKAGVSPLDAAIAKGFTAALIDRDVVTLKGPAGETALHVAVDRLSIDAVKVILALSPDLSARDSSGRTPLDSAFMHPASQAGAAIAELLVSRNAPTGLDDFSYFVRAVRDTNYSRARFAEGATVLHEAVRFDHRGYLSFFLERGVSVEAKNASGATALHDAVRLGRLECVRILLDKGADTNARDGQGNTPLRLALSAPQADKAAATLLEAGADPSIKDKDGNTALHVAVELGYASSFLETLMERGAPVDAANTAGDTALSIALRRKNATSAVVLAGKGASMFIKNAVGETPLSIALADGPETTGILLGASSKSASDDSGESPYHHAVRLAANADTIRVMKEIGLDPSARNNEGDTALLVAVRMNAETQGVALLEAGSDPFSANATGTTPLELALRAPTGQATWFF
ncbi:MAG: ankyrin repeat domain-containing protein, partial [Spirochaetales bacterium]|nr:ankyrin repeat domain-containing protein [Spirochaetales bacterium]